MSLLISPGPASQSESPLPPGHPSCRVSRAIRASFPQAHTPPPRLAFHPGPLHPAKPPWRQDSLQYPSPLRPFHAGRMCSGRTGRQQHLQAILREPACAPRARGCCSHARVRACVRAYRDCTGTLVVWAQRLGRPGRDSDGWANCNSNAGACCLRVCARVWVSCPLPPRTQARRTPPSTTLSHARTQIHTHAHTHTNSRTHAQALMRIYPALRTRLPEPHSSL